VNCVVCSLRTSSVLFSFFHLFSSSQYMIALILLTFLALASLGTAQKEIDFDGTVFHGEFLNVTLEEGSTCFVKYLRQPFELQCHLFWGVHFAMIDDDVSLIFNTTSGAIISINENGKVTLQVSYGWSTPELRILGITIESKTFPMEGGAFNLTVLPSDAENGICLGGNLVTLVREFDQTEAAVAETLEQFKETLGMDFCVVIKNLETSQSSAILQLVGNFTLFDESKIEVGEIEQQLFATLRESLLGLIDAFSLSGNIGEILIELSEQRRRNLEELPIDCDGNFRFGIAAGVSVPSGDTSHQLTSSSLLGTTSVILMHFSLRT